MTNNYFSSLNYTLANEDNRLEVEMVKMLLPQKILSVAGSGGRSLPLLVCKPSELTVVDLSQEQLWLVALRKAVIEQLSFDDFLLFWGFPPFHSAENNEVRKRKFKTLNLEPEVSKYFLHVFEEQNWASIIYVGKWERTFRKFSFLPKLLIGEKVLNHFLTLNSLTEQVEFYHREFPQLKWELIIRILGNATVFNALLYKGHFVKKNIEEDYYHFYFGAFERLFTRGMVKENYFLQLCLFGEIKTMGANPIEANSEVFESCKQTLKQGSQVLFEKSDINSLTLKNKKYDFVSFSDVPSYFSGDTERNFLQNLKKILNPGAVVVIRYYLHICKTADVSGYKDVSSDYQKLVDEEKVQMYHIKIYQLDSNQ